MNDFSTPIIPIQQTFIDLEKKKIISWKQNINKELDYKAIASFCSLGFMLDDDTFSKNIEILVFRAFRLLG